MMLVLGALLLHDLEFLLDITLGSQAKEQLIIRGSTGVLLGELA